MYKFVYEKDNKIISIFTGNTKKDCITHIFNKYARYNLLVNNYHQNKDGSVFKIIRED